MRTNNKLNPHMTPSLGIRPWPHWWEANAQPLCHPCSPPTDTVSLCFFFLKVRFLLVKAAVVKNHALLLLNRLNVFFKLFVWQDVCLGTRLLVQMSNFLMDSFVFLTLASVEEVMSASAFHFRLASLHFPCIACLL